MKILPKRKKNFLYIVLLFVLLFYFVINYFNPTILHDINYNYNDKINIKPNRVDTINELKLKNQNYTKHNSIKNEIKIEKEFPADPSVNVRMRYYAIDGNGLSSINTIITKCIDGIEIEVTNDMKKADFSYFLNSVPSILDKKANHFYMVYAMESEPHSGGGETWLNADFRMWYNLDLSFPEVKINLKKILSFFNINFSKQ